jgi:hypothetical protein
MVSTEGGELENRRSVHCREKEGEGRECKKREVEY